MRFCNLCEEPMWDTIGYHVCTHCDDGCDRTSTCGGCQLADEWEPDDIIDTTITVFIIDHGDGVWPDWSTIESDEDMEDWDDDDR